MPGKRGRWVPVLGTLTAAVCIGGLALWLLSRPARPLPASPGLPQATPVLARQELSSPTETPSGVNAVAWINGNPLPVEALMQRQALDRALNALLNIPATDEATALDRLVNETLLLSAAEAAGFSVTPESVAAEREALLAAYGKSTAELEAALQAEGFSLAAFDAYLANLIAARDFSAAQAQARGITAEAFILELRQDSDVRLDAAVVAALSKQAPEPVSAPVDPTPTPTDDAPRGTGVGQRAPGFALPVLSSDPPAMLNLDALRGQPVVLSFWVTWCSHCRAQTPLLVDAHARYADEEIQIVGVNVHEAPDVVQRYVDQQGILYPVVLDADGRVAQQYQVSGYPTTYFLDAEGRVLARHVGQLNLQTLEQYLALAR